MSHHIFVKRLTTHNYFTMTFKIDGSSHKNGLSNEETSDKVLNKANVIGPLFPLGGTQQKADLGCGTIQNPTGKGVTCKRVQHMNSGSHDLFNTSALPAEIKLITEPFLSQVKIFKETLTESERLEPKFLAQIKRELNKITSQALDEIPEVSLRKLLNDHILLPHASIPYTCLTDVTAQKIHVLKTETLPTMKAIASGLKPVLMGKAKASRKLIFLNKEGHQVNTGLVFRITTNNGIRSLLGVNPKNKNCSIVIKVAQFKRSELIKLSTQVCNPLSINDYLQQ